MDKEEHISKALLRAICNALPHMLFVKDAQGRFVYANTSFLEFLGVEENTLIGKTDAHFGHDAEMRLYFQKMDREVLETGGSREIPLEYATDSAHKVVALNTKKVNCNGSYVLGISTRIEHTAGVGGLIDQIIEQAPDGIYVKDARYRKYLLVNSAFVELMQMESSEQLLGKTIRTIGHAYADQAEDEDNQVVKGVSISGRTRLVYDAKTGVTKTLRTNKLPLKDSRGRTVGIMGFVKDITKIELMERAAAWHDFATKLAHQLKSRLFLLETKMEMLTTRLGSNTDPIVTQTIHGIDVAFEQLREFLKLCSSRITLDLARAPRSVFPINVLEKLKPLFTSEGIAFDIHVRTNECAYVDERVLYEILLELGVNATKQIRKRLTAEGALFKGVISVIVSERLTTLMSMQEKRLVIDFSDNGIGVPSEQKELLFVERYTTTVGGWGIGLSDVKRVLDSIGGAIAEVGVYGQGARFLLVLPCAGANATNSAMQP